MTPTPQERTELQRLAEQATQGEWRAEHSKNHLGWDVWCVVSGDTVIYGWDSEYEEANGSLEDAAYIAACSPAAILDLLSLAAESEELRAELEKERAERRTERLSAEQARNGALNAIDMERESRRILESRYTALEKAAREIGTEIERQENEGTADPDDDAVFIDRRLLKALATALDTLTAQPQQGTENT